jgi:hypothetical protein
MVRIETKSGQICLEGGHIGAGEVVIRKARTLDWCGKCRKRKDRPDRGSNPGHPYFMKGVLTTALPSRFVEEPSTPTRPPDSATNVLVILRRMALFLFIYLLSSEAHG